MSTSLNIKTAIISIFLILVGCGGGGGDNNDPPPDNPTAITISGKAQAPSGSIASLDINKPVMLAVLDFIIPPSPAAVTGLAPVANTTVELVRIDDDGNQVGALLASTTTNASGEYSLELPDGVSASPDLVVQIKNSSNQPVLRAIVTGDSVDIDPVSQFILDALIDEPGLVLADIDLETVQTLVQQVAAIDVELSSVATLQDAQNAVANNTNISEAVQAVASAGPASLISGSYAFGDINEPGMLVLYPDGHYIHWQDCTDSEDGVGVEYGSYDYDGTTFSATPEVDENGDCGLSGWQLFPVSVNNDELVFEENGQSISLARNTGGSDSIVGAWDTRFSSTDGAGLVFYSSGAYIQYQNANDLDPCPGVEYGTYAYDGSTITGNIIRDDNLDCGLGEGTGGFSISTVTVANNVITFDDGAGDAVMFERVGTSLAGNETTTSFDMTQFTAVSQIIYSLCPEVPGGYEYSFSANSMTLTGSDGWQTPGCILSQPETFSENLPLPGFDIPFNCTNYPICTLDDFNGEISGTDQDNRQFTSTFSFNSETNVLTYVKSVEGTTFTETITIQPLP